MTYAIVVDVPQPTEMYTKVNAEVDKQLAGREPDGLIFHVARPTSEGFQVIEVWDSKEQADRFTAETLGPLIDRVSGGMAPRRQDLEKEFPILGIRGRQLSIDLRGSRQTTTS